MIDGQLADPEPRGAQLALVAEHISSPLGRTPHAKQHNREHDRDLADEEFSGGHFGLRTRLGRSGLGVGIYIMEVS